MVPSTFKRRYAQICHIFGGTRRLNEGRPCDDCEETAPYSLEIKYGVQLTQEFQNAMIQAVTNAPKNLLPTVVLAPKRWADNDCWVCFRLGDFREWFLSSDPTPWGGR